jgi:hypothetical protein
VRLNHPHYISPLLFEFLATGKLQKSAWDLRPAAEPCQQRSHTVFALFVIGQNARNLSDLPCNSGPVPEQRLQIQRITLSVWIESSFP